MSFVRDICRRYPESFVDHDTIEASPPPVGWRPLLLSLFDELVEALGSDPTHKVAVLRVGTECGGLRIAYEMRPEPEHDAAITVVAQALVAAAERRSLEVCGVCGAPGSLWREADGRHAVLCERHVDSGILDPVPRASAVTRLPELNEVARSPMGVDGITRWMCRHFPDAIEDATEGDAVPAGWRRLCADLLVDLVAMMGGARDRRIRIRFLGIDAGGLGWNVVTPPSVPAVVQRGMVIVLRCAAELADLTCPSCGHRTGASTISPTTCSCGTTHGGGAPLRHPPVVVVRPPRMMRRSRAHPAGRPRRASPGARGGGDPFRIPLYRRTDVAAAMGVTTQGEEGPRLWMPRDLDDMESRDTEQQARLRSILERGDGGRWRRLVAPTPEAISAVAAMSALAPHLSEVVDHVVRHLRAAHTIGLPIQLPPTLVVGPPGVGKTWLLQRVASTLGVPYRNYPMNIASTNDGLCGSYPVWRNAQPGVLARTLLGEDAANPMVLLDEFDKVNFHNGADGYRALYTLLEPVNARAFVDEFLGFPMDASHVMWVASANSVEGLPEPILDRLVVLRAPMPDLAHLGAVVASIYRDANSARRMHFEPNLDPEVVAILVRMSPRAIRVVIEDGMVRAAASGRRRIARDDLVERRTRDTPTFGFIQPG